MTSLTILSLHLLNLIHISVVLLLPVRGRRVVHVSRARHGGLSPTTLGYFLNKYPTIRIDCTRTAYSHLWRPNSDYCTSRTSNARGLLPLNLVIIRTFLINSGALSVWVFTCLQRYAVNFQRVFTSGAADVCKFQHKGPIIDRNANSTLLIL